MSENIKPLYSIAQKDVYSVMETALGNFDMHQAEFEDFKGLYKAPYSENAKAAIAAAKAMPDNEARGSVAETLRITLKENGVACLNYFQRLKRYIVTAYPNKEMHKPQFEAAGDNYYEEAGNEDWESMEMLNQGGKNYIAANSALLSDGGLNMPASFEAAYVALCDVFSATYSSFKQAEQTSEETADKLVATNACFVTCMDMLKDGQVLFSGQVDVRSKFVFQNLVDLINPSRAGLKGIVKDSVSFEPMAGVQVETQKAGESASNTVTDVDGKYSVQLAESTYKVTVSATGYVTQAVDVDITKGSFKTMVFELVKEM